MQQPLTVDQFPIRLVLNGKASKEIEWHCKHYVGRGLMKRFENGEALAKEIGISASELKKTFDDYNTSVRTKKDPFGKKVCILLTLSLVYRSARLTLPHSSSPLANGP